jgi:hypothetical protein
MSPKFWIKLFDSTCVKSVAKLAIVPLLLLLWHWKRREEKNWLFFVKEFECCTNMGRIKNGMKLLGFYPTFSFSFFFSFSRRKRINI